MNSKHFILRRILSFSLAVIALSLAAEDSSAAGWGSVKGKFLYKGAVKPEEISVTKDPAFCSKHKLVTEEIVTSEKNELANVFVYLYTSRGDKIDIHPDYEKAELKPAVLDNKGCRFEPHAMTLWTKQHLEIRNSDEGIGHNTNATLRKNPRFNETVTNEKPITKKFDKTEPAPSPFACNVHPWMTASVLIRDNPYMAVSDKKGEFVIKNLPAGKHDLIFFHEADGYMSKLVVGKEKADRKGRVEVKIEDGKTLDFGEIVVTPKLLGK